jgi:hypothetical protein
VLRFLVEKDKRQEILAKYSIKGIKTAKSVGHGIMQAIKQVKFLRTVGIANYAA